MAKVLIAIPVYNEQQHISAVLDEVARHHDHILVIDDGSTDDSSVILAKRKDICMISHRQNCGYGCAIIQAIGLAQSCIFDWLITMDCDLQHEPARIPDFMAAIAENNADIISGSRYLGDSERNGSPPPDRRNINKTVTGWINRQLDLNITDAFCGFKAHRLSEMKKLNLTERGYAFPLEFWVEAAHHELRIREIPVSLIYHDPDRHFGGDLDNADIRLEHYRDVFKRSLGRIGREVPDGELV